MADLESQPTASGRLERLPPREPVENDAAAVETTPEVVESPGLKRRLRASRVGQIFGVLRVIKQAGHYIRPSGERNSRLWECLCDPSLSMEHPALGSVRGCGATHLVTTSNFRTVSSCGCLRKQLDAVVGTTPQYIAFRERGRETHRKNATNRGVPRCTCAGTRRSPKARMCHKCENLWRNYKMTLAQWQDLFDRQQGLCLVCLEPLAPDNIAVDHCHTTNLVRALVCTRPCNLLIGYAYDKPDRLIRAAGYFARAEALRANHA